MKRHYFQHDGMCCRRYCRRRLRRRNACRQRHHRVQP
jgi:hypothetical protein